MGSQRGINSAPQSTNNKRRKTHVSHACERCQARRLGCDYNSTCNQCQKYGLLCVRSGIDRRRKKDRFPEAPEESISSRFKTAPQPPQRINTSFTPLNETGISQLGVGLASSSYPVSIDTPLSASPHPAVFLGYELRLSTQGPESALTRSSNETIWPSPITPPILQDYRFSQTGFAGISFGDPAMANDQLILLPPEDDSMNVWTSDGEDYSDHNWMPQTAYNNYDA